MHLLKRGVTQQLFLFFFALLMIAFVLVFGIRNVVLVTDTAQKVETLTFISDLQKLVKTYSTLDAGSKKFVKLSLPSPVNQLCFFNPDLSLGEIHDPVFRSFLTQEKRYNLYVLPLERFQNPGPGFSIEHLTVLGEPNPLCFLTNGELTAMIETVVVDNTISVVIRKV